MTSGFYKRYGDVLIHAPNSVYAPTFTLTRETKGEADGWRWFDGDDLAYEFYGLIKPEANTEDEQEVLSD